MEVKQCRQCGEMKPLEQFRKYYGGRKGTYTICRSCEKINSRAKYLRAKGESINYEEESELYRIEMLYDAQRACGLQPPSRSNGRSTKLVDNLDDMIAKYKNMANTAIEQSGTISPLPPELRKWLSTELIEEPDYYLDEVYEDLKAKYRPVMHVDQESMMPVYDDTYKEALETILTRFNDYEDKYYESN
jgi:hypothetical protein